MDCGEFKKSLALFLDNKLDRNSRETLKEHLRSCSKCAGVFNSITKMVDIMGEKKDLKGKRRWNSIGANLDSKKLIKLAGVVLAALLVVGVIIIKFGANSCGRFMPCNLANRQADAPIAADKRASAVAKKNVVKEEKTKTIVTELKVGNLIAKNKQQQWLLVADNPKNIAKQMQSLLSEFKATDIAKEELKSEGNKTTKYKFAVRFWQLNPLADDLSTLGALEKHTPFPVIRSEAYINSRGGVNPLVLEEKIFLELTLDQ